MAVRRILHTVLCAALVATAPAHAEPKRVLSSSRVRLADIAQTSDPDLAELDLGPAPPPGSSRLFARDEVLLLLKSFGASPAKISMQQTVRVSSAARRFTPRELGELVEPSLRAALPAGVTLKELRVSRPLLASPRVEVGEVRIPRMLRRAGDATLTASVDLMHEGSVAHRLPVTLQVVMSEEAAAPLIRKGARVDLVIARGPARISASAVALDDADLGDVRSFRVSSTHKVLRARVESSTLALVVTP
jgi:hypothetical protein